LIVNLNSVPDMTISDYTEDNLLFHPGIVLPFFQTFLHIAIYWANG